MHRAWLTGHVLSLLEFYKAMLDRNGRFVELDDDGRPLGGTRSATGQPQSLLTVARAVHCFALAELLGVPGSSQIVERGLDALWNEHRDTRSGGYVASTDASGWADTTKAAYGHAFVLLAASSARAAGHDAAALYHDVLAVVDERFWSERAGAAREAFDREWNELEPYRGANSNMHLCEAFLAASDASGDGALAARAVRIAELLIDEHARSAGWMLPEHYDLEWRPERGYNRDRLDDAFRPYGVTVGHLLEWSRLCLSAWLASGRGHDWLPDAAVGLFDRAVAVGWDDTVGGLVYTVDWDGSPANSDRYWWTLAEGIGASSYLGRLTGDRRYEKWYRVFWDFASDHFVDHRRGGWYAQLDESNRRTSGPWHGKPDLYHVLQSAVLPLVPLSPSVAGALLAAAARPLPPLG